MKRKSPKPIAGNKNLQKTAAGRRIAPPAYGINFVDRQDDSDGAVIQDMFESPSEKTFSGESDDKIITSLSSNFRSNDTGLPDSLKSGIENLSGFSMDAARVHYNSFRPAQLNALAYAQGTDIHVAPGQEQHLPHEAWHVVQQKQGRVQPTTQMKDRSVSINDDAILENEADVMGAKALARGAHAAARSTSPQPPKSAASPFPTSLKPIQLDKGKKKRKEEKEKKKAAALEKQKTKNASDAEEFAVARAGSSSKVRQIESEQVASALEEFEVSKRKSHILNRHRHGAGVSGKTEFPAGWDDDKILNAITVVCMNTPTFSVDPTFGPFLSGFFEGIKIEVYFYPIVKDDDPLLVSTAYPPPDPPRITVNP